MTTSETKGPTTIEEIQATVQARYGAVAKRVAEGATDASCCGSSGSSGCCGSTAETWDPITSHLYDAGQTAGLPSAKRVGPTGKAYGLDMTDEMLALALENKAKAGATNVEFLKGHIESIPLPSNTVDVIISNCVINLSADKRTVLAEAFRVLKPGGRFAVSDIMTRGELPADVRRSMELWSGCVAGALDEQEFLNLLSDVGFENASIEPTRIYS